MPLNNNLYVITPVFNPFGFQSRRRLYHNFAKHMADSGAKLFTIELAFGDKPFVVTSADDPMNAQLRSSEILWHKERLINIAYERLLHVVPDARFIGWFDSDVTFVNPDWVGQSVHKLTHLDVIQPFSSATNLNGNEDFMWNCPSSFRAFIEGRGFHQEPPLPVSYTYRGHPGLAWCATRAALDRMGGLYDKCVAGSADTIMSNALKGDWSVYLPGAPSQAMKDSMAKYAERANAVVRGRIGFTQGMVLHHWHGASESRGYEKRWSILSFHQFDPMVDIRTDTNGTYRWSGNKPRLEDDIRLSLSARNEDAP